MAVTTVRMLPAVVLCVALLLPTPVQATTVSQWLELMFNAIKTFLFHFIPSKGNHLLAVDSTVADLTNIMQEVLPEQKPTANYEEAHLLQGKIYVCMGSGTARNFKSITKEGNAQCIWENDSAVRVFISYRLQEFIVHYEHFYFRGFGIKKRGTLILNFRKNKLVIEVRIPHVLTLLTESSPCAVQIMNVDFVELTDTKVTINSDGLTHGALTSKVVNRALVNHNKFLMKELKKKVLKELYKKLPQATTSVCTSPGLDQMAKELGAREKKVYTEMYDRRCGSGFNTASSSNEAKLRQPRRSYGRKQKLQRLFNHLRHPEGNQ